MPQADEGWKSLLAPHGDLTTIDQIDKWLEEFGDENFCDGEHELGGCPSAYVMEDSDAQCCALLRLTFDNEAGFSWGSNVLYLLIANDDLQRGNWDRTRSLMANY